MTLSDETTLTVASHGDMSGEAGAEDVENDSRRKTLDASRRLMDTLFKSVGNIPAPKVGEIVSGTVLSRRGPYIYVD